MFRRPIRPRRRGAATVEYAIVLPIFFMLTFGTIIVGYGVFASNEMAAVAREGARWAAVHGGNWKKENSKPLTTAADVYTKGILPHVAGLNTSKLTYSVTWSDPNQMSSPPSTVTVTVNYSWTPQLYLGPMTLTGKSTMTMSY